jgi:hypothetical protein
MLEEPIKEGVPPKMKGSVLMCVADTEEEVLDRVKKDVYYTSDVWDKEKVSDIGAGRCEGGLRKLSGVWWRIVEDLFANCLSRCRSFRSRALSGRHLSERGKMKSRHAR